MNVLTKVLRRNMYQNQGNIAESIAATYYMSLGCVVSKPLNHSSYYDLLVDNGSSVTKVEVKSTSQKTKSGKYIVCLKTSGGNKRSNYIKKLISSNTSDKIFIVDKIGNCYEYLSTELENMTQKTLDDTKLVWVVPQLAVCKTVVKK